MNAHEAAQFAAATTPKILDLVYSLVTEGRTQPDAWAELRAQLDTEGKVFAFWYALTFCTAHMVKAGMTGCVCDHNDGNHTFGLQFGTTTGDIIDTDQVPPAPRLYGRWFTAAMNGDLDTAIALWETIPADPVFIDTFQDMVLGNLIDAGRHYFRARRDG